MEYPQVKEHNAATGEITMREMTDSEYAEYQARQAADAIQTKAQNEAETEKAALLAKLGITADEAKLLLS